jgi:hypothetical protein
MLIWDVFGRAGASQVGARNQHLRKPVVLHPPLFANFTAEGHQPSAGARSLGRGGPHTSSCYIYIDS